MPELLAPPSPNPTLPLLPATLELAELADAELRLLARAVGEHLPVELADRVLELRVRRARLEAAL